MSTVLRTGLGSGAGHVGRPSPLTTRPRASRHRDSGTAAADAPCTPDARPEARSTTGAYTRGAGGRPAGPMGTLSSFTVPFQPVGRAQLQPPRHACRRLQVKATSVAAPPSVDVSSDVIELGKSGMCCQFAICRVVLTSASVMYAGSNRVLYWNCNAGLKVSSLGIGAWSWGDRTGYWVR